jgi:hypothetical protein
LVLKACDTWLNAWQGRFDIAQTPLEKTAICAWVMQRVVRSLFEAVMLATHVYSRDIYPCAKLAAEHFPAHQDTIWTAALLAVEPTNDNALMTRTLMKLSPLLLDLQAQLKSQRDQTG